MVTNASQTSLLSDTLTAWNAQCDRLATHLMIEGPGPALLEDLAQLRRMASGAQAIHALTLLDHMTEALLADPSGAAKDLLDGGLLALQGSFATRADKPALDPVISLGDDPELVADFLVEAREHLSKIEGQMLALERDPTCMEVVHGVFRAFHTIKGLAGFLDFSSVQAVAHEVETILDLARNARLTITPAAVDVILESGDFLTRELALIEHALKHREDLRPTDYHTLAIKIASLAFEGETCLPMTDDLPEPPAAKSEPVDSQPVTTAGTTFADAEGKGFIKLYSKEERAAMRPAAPLPIPPAATAPAAVSAAAAGPAATKEPSRISPDAGSVRVDTAKLDHLMDMVGEIVIAQSLIRHNPAFSAASDSRLLSDLAQLARATGEVQRATMSMRMVPVAHVFQRVERVIRDLSRKAGKLVVLESFGSDTEIDKTVAEELSDPLLHMVRNSVDHGIETTEERKAAGKPAEARIKLSARHQSGLVVIEISDDGRGLNPVKIRQKAEDRGLIAPNTVLTEPEIHQLIFEPGFSTAEKVTDVSGRGVGMDVVRRNVEKLRGRIEIESTFGVGTTFTLKLPLTLAIIDGLVVEVGAGVGKQRFIIPISAIREMFRPEKEAYFTVEGRAEMLLVRGQLLPIIRLDRHLGIVGRAVEPSDGLVVIVESHGKPFCLLVDDLLGKQEVVIKSLGETFQNASALSGCAVLGDGCVGLILDVDGIFRGGTQ